MKTSLSTSLIFIVLLLSNCKNSEKSAASTEDQSRYQPQITYPAVTVDEGFVQVKNKVPVTIKYMEMDGDLLTIAVSYSGGCEEHEFELISNGAYAKSYPPQLTLFLKHNDKNDRCRSVVDKNLTFDLQPIQYPGTGQVVLKFNNTKENIKYNY